MHMTLKLCSDQDDAKNGEETGTQTSREWEEKKRMYS